MSRGWAHQDRFAIEYQAFEELWTDLFGELDGCRILASLGKSEILTEPSAILFVRVFMMRPGLLWQFQ